MTERVGRTASLLPVAAHRRRTPVSSSSVPSGRTSKSSRRTSESTGRASKPTGRPTKASSSAHVTSAHRSAEPASSAHEPSSAHAHTHAHAHASSSHAHPAAHASSEATSGGRKRESVLADLESASEPVEPVELGDRVLSVVDSLVHNRARSLGSTVLADLDVGSDDGTGGSEEILEVLPVGLVRELATRKKKAISARRRSEEERGKGGTDVSDVDLPGSSSGRASGEASSEPTSSSAHRSSKSAGRGGSAEPGLLLSVLSDEDGSAEERLVGKLGDRSGRVLLGRELDNAEEEG